MKKNPGTEKPFTFSRLQIADRKAILDNLNGIPLPPGYQVTRIPIPPTPAELRAIRKQLKLSQNKFADLLNTPSKTYQNWEQGLRQPAGAVTLILRLIEKHPAVAGMLSELNSESPAL